MSITSTGLGGNGDEQVKQAMQQQKDSPWCSQDGSAHLEHNIAFHLITDRHP